MHVQWNRKWDSGALWKDGSGMQAVETEVTGEHGTSSGLVERCADASGANQIAHRMESGI